MSRHLKVKNPLPRKFYNHSPEIRLSTFRTDFQCNIRIIQFLCFRYTTDSVRNQKVVTVYKVHAWKSDLLVSIN
jgi:hypothetical protein